jgi:hypothetical protein
VLVKSTAPAPSCPRMTAAMTHHPKTRPAPAHAHMVMHTARPCLQAPETPDRVDPLPVVLGQPVSFLVDTVSSEASTHRLSSLPPRTANCVSYRPCHIIVTEKKLFRCFEVAFAFAFCFSITAGE